MLDREIKLLIQAQLKGGRDIASITKSIGDLEKAIDSQADAAKRGESSYEGLKAASAALKTVQEELAGRSSVLKHFETLTKQIDKQSQAVDKAKKKLTDFEAKVGDDRTDKQQQQVLSLTKSYQAQSATLDQYRKSLEVVGAALHEAGADTSRLGDEQRQITEQSLAAAVAQNRISKELLAYNDTIAKGTAATKAKGEADRKAAKDADLFAAAEKRADDAARNRAAGLKEAVDLHIKRQAQRVADSALASEDARVVKRQQDALKRAQELAALRADIEQRSAATDRDVGLRKTADDAEAAAQKFTTLARASTDLRPKVVTLREALAGIIDPSAKVRQTLSGVEGQIKELTDTIAGSKGPIKDYSDQFQRLEAAQKAVQGQAALIDSFRKQTEAMRASVLAMVEARAEVAKYAAAVRQGGEAGAAFVKPLADAQAKLRLASLAMREQVSATREIGNALRAAGIDTRALADAEQRLIAATTATTAAMKQLEGAAVANGHAVGGSAKAFSLFRDEGRTTLSIAQRLRGEILGLITAYIGVQAAISLATSALDAFKKTQAVQSVLGFALGTKSNAPEVAAEIVYLREQTERLGVEFETAAKGFGKFSASARKSGASAQETRFIFESFSEVGTVLNLTADQLGGVFNAIEQSFSKGAIQAEELRGQIGDRLPAAFAFAQEALKNVFPDLNKALKDGKVGAEQMVVIAESFRRAAAEQLPQAIKSLNAEQQRFNNSVFFFKQQIAEAGFADAYVKLLKELTELMKGNDGKEFAKTLSDIASAFVNGVGVLAKYREEVGLLALILGSILSAKLVSSLAAGLFTLQAGASAAGVAMGAPAIAARALAASTLAAAGGVTTLSVAFGLLGRAMAFLSAWTGVILLLAAAFVYLTGKFPLFGIAATQTFEEIVALSKFLAAELPNQLINSFKSMINGATFMGRKLITVFSNIFRAIGLEGMAKVGEQIRDALTLDTTSTTFANAETLNRALDKIRLKAQDAAKAIGAVGSFNVLEGPKAPSVTGFPGVRPGKPNTEDADKAANKLKAEIESIQKALDALGVSALKKQGETLDSLLAAVDLQYKDLGERIAVLGGPVGQKFAKEFATGILALKVEITKDFNDKILKEQEALQDKLAQVSAAAGRKDKDELQARLDAIFTAHKHLYEDIAKVREGLLSQRTGQTPDRQSQVADAFAEEAKRQLDGDVAKMQNLERIKFLVEQLAKQEAKVNDLLHAREIALKRIQEQVAAGTLTSSQGDTASTAVIAQMQPGLAAALDTAREFALVNEAAFDPARLQEFLLKLDQARNSSAALGASFDRVGQIIDRGIGAGIDNTFNALYESIGALIQRTGTWGDVFKAVGRSILNSIAEILKAIALQIIKEQILIQLQIIKLALGGGGGGAAGSFAYTVPTAAKGGVVSRMSPTRSVDPAWFAAAPRYGAGGMVGMQPDEFPAILHKNEEVLSASNPRNAVNGGAMSASAKPQSQRFVLVDDRSRVAEAMAGAEGEQVTLLHLKRNIPTLRQLIKA